MLIRDRIKELRRVPAADLRPSARNWRDHPEAQRDALRGILAEVGYADALLARELADGTLELIDGHLRAETTPDQVVPVLVLDVDEHEATKILATHDPLAAMATSNASKLDSLLRDVGTGSEALQAMLADLADKAGLYKTSDAPDATGNSLLDGPMPEGRYSEQYGVIVICKDEAEQKSTYEALQESGYTCRVVVT